MKEIKDLEMENYSGLFGDPKYNYKCPYERGRRALDTQKRINATTRAKIKVM